MFVPRRRRFVRRAAGGASRSPSSGRREEAARARLPRPDRPNEFSVPLNPALRLLYHVYSFQWVPLAGRVICGTSAPFRYLAESIRVFPPAEHVSAMIAAAGFCRVQLTRLLGGIAVLYSGVRPEADGALDPGGRR